MEPNKRMKEMSLSIPKAPQNFIPETHMVEGKNWICRLTAGKINACKLSVLKQGLHPALKVMQSKCECEFRLGVHPQLDQRWSPRTEPGRQRQRWVIPVKIAPIFCTVHTLKAGLISTLSWKQRCSPPPTICQCSDNDGTHVLILRSQNGSNISVCTSQPDLKAW